MKRLLFLIAAIIVSVSMEAQTDKRSDDCLL